MDEQRKPQKDIARRVKVLHLLFICVVAYFFVHIVVFIFHDEELAQGFEKVHNSLIDTLKIAAHRGNIYSRDGDLLATSITRTTVRIDFGCERFQKMGEKKYNQEAAVLAQTLAECLKEGTADEYYEKLVAYNKKFINYHTEVKTTETRKWIFFTEERTDTIHTATVNKGRRSLRIFRDVDANELEVIKKVPLLSKGRTYTTEEQDHRIYPHGNLAMRIIGRKDNKGSYGIEGAYDKTLTGRDGMQLIQKVASQLKIRVEDEMNAEAQNGCDIVTTLDINVQDIADNALREQLLAQKAEFGTAIVMECATGDVLAMVNLKRKGKECFESENYAIGKTLNPGSTFKLVSAMALLENGVPVSQKYDSGSGNTVPVGGSLTDAKVRDSHAILGKNGTGIIDMREAFVESANVYFTKAVLDKFKDNPIAFSDFCSNLYCDTIVGLGELGARFKRYKPLDKKHQSRYNALVNMAYGYGFEITPLHTIAIYNAIANKGRMVAPRLILRTERNGEIINNYPVQVLKEEVCSQSTLNTLHSFLEGVSQEGTAKGYFGKKECSFSSGSKTGTAQVEAATIGEKSGKYYVGSMVTYFPAENPRYTIMTAIVTSKPTQEEIQKKIRTYYGAGLAGPVQQRIAKYLYNRDFSNAKEITTESKYSPIDVKGGKIEKIQTLANEYNVSLSADSASGWGNSSTSSDSTRVNVTAIGVVNHIVPNVMGMGLSDALFILEKCGLKVKFEGQGKVVEQSLSANTPIEAGHEITIRLE